MISHSLCIPSLSDGGSILMPDRFNYMCFKAYKVKTRRGTTEVLVWICCGEYNKQNIPFPFSLWFLFCLWAAAAAADGDDEEEAIFSTEIKTLRPSSSSCCLLGFVKSTDRAEICRISVAQNLSAVWGLHQSFIGLCVVNLPLTLIPRHPCHQPNGIGPCS